MVTTALYIHIPFCVKRCHYCDFRSSVYSPPVVEAYLLALNEEITQRAVHLPLDTLYLGGGTPTALSCEELHLLGRMIKTLSLRDVEEFTVEANPGTLTMEKLILLREMGCNRISLGVQTFHPRGLKILGRIHSAREARLAVGLCQEAGFDNLSIDLISGWPGETLSEWYDDLERTAGLGITHLSAYGLTYEEGTELFHRRERMQLRPTGEALERKMLDMTAPCLERHGFARYEISSYAKPGFSSRHNRIYWEGGDYSGLGAAAHSLEEGKRFSNSGDIEEYIRRITTSGIARDWEETLAPERSARERAVFWLRLLEGINRPRFLSECGYEVEQLFAEELPPLLKAGWLEMTSTTLKLSAAALPVADSILSELI